MRTESNQETQQGNAFLDLDTGLLRRDRVLLQRTSTADLYVGFGRRSELMDKVSVLEALEKAGYNPDEPRDEKGRWSLDGIVGALAAAVGEEPNFIPIKGSKMPPPVWGDFPDEGPGNRDWCIEKCTELALPTGDPQGVPFYRCMNQCMGTNDYPEWRPFFPPPANRSRFPSPNYPLPY